jgi:hypothetical protein
MEMEMEVEFGKGKEGRPHKRTLKNDAIKIVQKLLANCQKELGIYEMEKNLRNLIWHILISPVPLDSTGCVMCRR